MTRSTKIRLTMIGALLLVAALLVAMCSSLRETGQPVIMAKVAAVSSATDDSSHLPDVLVPMKVDRKGRPRVRVVTGDYSVQLAFGVSESDFGPDDLTVPQLANTAMVYHLPAIKRGSGVEWYILVIDPATKRTLTKQPIVFDWWRPARWTKRFVWKTNSIPPGECQIREYHFSLQERPRTVNLTPKSKFRVRIKQANGQVVVRRYDLSFGDGDLVLVLDDELAPGEQVLRVAITATGKYRLPRKDARLYCLPGS